MASKARAKSRGKIGKGKRRRTPKPTFDNREAAIAQAAKKTKKGNVKSLEQSVGSLDRRINKAIQKGDLDVAKDLRSRKNKFTTDLGLARAINLKDGVARSKDGKIIRTSTGQPVLTDRGREIFDQTKDLDFVDSTRRLQNVAPDAYKEMYPIGSALQKGPLGLQMIKNALNRKDKDIPYRYPGTDNIFGEGDFPAQRYPLEYMGVPDPAPTEEVTIADLVPEVQPMPEISIEFPGADILESQGISENFIYPINEATGEQEVGNTPLQLAYDDEVLAALNNNIAQHLDSKGRYTEKLNNPFMYPENKKAELVAEAINNQRKLNDQQKENLEEKAISEAYINMYPNTELTEQSLSETLTGDRENTDLYSTVKDAGADLIYGLSGLDVKSGNEKLQQMRDAENLKQILSGTKYNLKPDIIQEVLQYNPNLSTEEADINSTLANFYQETYKN